MRRTRALTTGAALFALASSPLALDLSADAAVGPLGMASPSGKPGAVTPPEGGTLGDAVGGLPDIDLVGVVKPTVEQLQAAEVLIDRGARVTWGSRGTPQSVLPITGTLGAAVGATPAAGARAWLRSHADLLGLTAAQVDGLEVANDQDLITGAGVAKGSAGHITSFQQVFGPDRLAPAEDGLVNVAMRDGQVTYVSSSLARVTGTMPAATLTPLAGWLKAAANVGAVVPAAKITGIAAQVGTGRAAWTRLKVPGLVDVQNARLQALVLRDGSVRPVIQATVVSALQSLAHTVLVDAVDGSVLVRRNDVLNADDAGTASTTVGPQGVLPSTPPLPGAFSPQWRFFEANPALDFSPDTNADEGAQASVIGCWVVAEGCTAQAGAVASNVGSGEWDSISGASTMTTVGNNANTHEAWASPLSPGGAFQAPYSPLRDYTEEFTDVWNNSGCDPTNLIPTGNDINAVVANLFVGHNEIHDWAYHLGFTEDNFNLQLSNLGKGGMEGDAEVGNVQAGALVPASDPTGGILPGLPVTGRDNANQITQADGVAGITNQYLFQPLAGAFYSPCADGSLDTSIYGHEYTHAISTRMIGGASGGITSEQGGAMGESWGDLDAAEYMFAHDYSTGASPWAVGPYATGNGETGIRDYAIDKNPLNYSDYGFDTPGPEVHADGEIWNGTQWEVRQALVDAYDAKFPYANKALQLSCAKGDATTAPVDSSKCPGNRRWIQLIFDAFLLQNSDTSMLDARDAMIAADKTRYGGADVDALWAAFARRGMGADAKTVDGEDTDPTPGFSTPKELAGKNSAVTFTSTTPGKVYVGDFEARVTPVADTDPKTPLSQTASFTPGTYQMTYVSPTSGLRRFTLSVPKDGAAVVQAINDGTANLASAAGGAKVISSTEGSLNDAALIDGTEATNWAGITDDNVDTSQPTVAVDLVGDAPVSVGNVQVSALLRTADDVDADAASRFTALRKFAIDVCTTGCANPGATWTEAYVSPDDAFPSVRPRPVAPSETMRSFSFPAKMATAVRLRTLENQCTGGPEFSDASGAYDDGGEPALDLDPLNDTDCATASDRGTIVHASELQVFGSAQTSAIPAIVAGVTGATVTGKLLKTRTRVRLPRVQQVKGKESTKMKYSVVGIGGTSLGKIAGKATIKIDGKKVKKKNVVISLKKGKKVVGYTYKVPTKLGYGPHRIQVFYKSLNKGLYTNSKSRNILLTVVRSRR